ncbi:hypothetical protein D3273_08380 [Lichenibacterium minor]|uniref:Uncharacterized protein n=1 Tax=Lichenibacterium minor TaxID=2316528 RepID=A0A4Q2U925_9HYPH|nr:hypothetical protein [Lichenibacterium minor]RYC32398.1 hypothetical protein D3273_08380 [Lichenibacterium minor]
MANRFSTLLTAAAALTLLTAGAAEAQATRKAPAPRAQVAKAHHPVLIAEISDATVRKPLVIQKRSFLDPGTASTPALGQPEYFASQTSDHIPVYATYNTAFFGQSELPHRRFDLPNNPEMFPNRNIDFSPLWRGLD